MVVVVSVVDVEVLRVFVDEEGAGLTGFEDPGLSQGLGGEIRLIVLPV